MHNIGHRLASQFQEFVDAATENRIVLWGSGRYLQFAIDILREHNLVADFIIDSNFWKTKTTVMGLEVKNISALSELSPKDTVVLILTDYIFDVIDVLYRLGIDKYYAFPLFVELWYERSLPIWRRIELNRPYLTDIEESLNIQVVNKCNLRCAFCSFRNYSNGEIMTVAQYRQLLSQAKETQIMGKKIRKIRLDGNREALLHPELGEIFEQTKRFGFEMWLITNGVLLNDTNITLINKYCEQISISVTGVSAKVYGKYQGSGFSNCDRIIGNIFENVRKLADLRNKTNSRLRIQISYLGGDEDAIREFKYAVAKWKNVGADRIRINDNKDSTADFLRNCPELEYRENHLCIRTTIISVNGDVHPCCALGGENMVIGNAFETPLNQIFTSKMYFDFVESLMTIERMPQYCRFCPDYARCKQ